MTDVDLSEQLQAVAAQVLTPDQLTAFTAVAEQKFAGQNGEIDSARVLSNLRTVFGINDNPQPAPGARNWGQTTGQPAGQAFGSQARAALEKRHGVKLADAPPPALNATRERTHTALQKRHGTKPRHS